MSGMRARWLLLLTLALLGCTPRSNAEPSNACSVIEAEQLASRLRAADPHEQVQIVREGLDAICEWTLLGNYGDHDFGLSEAGEAMFARACPAARELGDEVHALTPEQLYERCDLARLQIIELDEYRLHARADLLLWTLYPWLIENGVSEEQARVIARARLRAELDWRDRLADLRLPAIAGDQQLWDAPLLQVSASAVSFVGETVVELADGVLPNDLEQARVIVPLFEALEREVEKAQQIAELLGGAWTGELLIAADPSTPFVTFERVAYTAERVGYKRLGLVVEPRLFSYRVVALSLSPTRDPRALDVTVYRDTQRVLINRAQPPDHLRSAAGCDGPSPPPVFFQGSPEIDYARLLEALVLYGACDERWLKIPAASDG